MYRTTWAVSVWMLGLQLAVTVSAAILGWALAEAAAARSALAGGGIALVATALLAAALLLFSRRPSRWCLLAVCVAEVLKLLLVGWLFVTSFSSPWIQPGVLLATFGAALATFFAAPLLPPLRRGRMPA